MSLPSSETVEPLTSKVVSFQIDTSKAWEKHEKLENWVPFCEATVFKGEFEEMGEAGFFVSHLRVDFFEEWGSKRVSSKADAFEVFLCD